METSAKGNNCSPEQRTVDCTHAIVRSSGQWEQYPEWSDLVTDAKPIRPVAFEDTRGQVRVVNDADDLGWTLFLHCSRTDPTYKLAMRALVYYELGRGSSEDARAAFETALMAAGLRVHGVPQ